jgi:crossover junction endodeoxyribonuclease RuvC
MEVHRRRKLDARRKEMKVMGLDLSLSSTGVVVLESDTWGILHVETIKSKPQEDETARIVMLGGKILQATQRFLPHLTVIEGPAFGMKNTNCIWQLGELAGIVKQYLYLHEFKVLIVPPTTLKKFITGKGNAKKDMMMLAVYKKYGVEFADDNQCDAYALARMGIETCK